MNSKIKIQKVDDTVEFLFDPNNSLSKIIVIRPQAKYFRPVHKINCGSYTLTQSELNVFSEALYLANILISFERVYFDEEGNRRFFENKTDNHTEHCCIIHGCKYCDENCTVMNRILPQSNMCMDCDYDKQLFEISRKLNINERRYDGN